MGACLPSCQTAPEEPPAAAPAPQESVVRRMLTEKAPSAAEMEQPLATTQAEPAEPGNFRIELAQPTEGASRPRPPMPPIQANPSPFIDEAATMKTRDLHGYDFPGVEAIQPPVVAEIKEEPLQAQAPKPVQVAKANPEPAGPARLPETERVNPASVPTAEPAAAHKPNVLGASGPVSAGNANNDLAPVPAPAPETGASSGPAMASVAVCAPGAAPGAAPSAPSTPAPAPAAVAEYNPPAPVQAAKAMPERVPETQSVPDTASVAEPASAPAPKVLKGRGKVTSGSEQVTEHVPAPAPEKATVAAQMPAVEVTAPASGAAAPAAPAQAAPAPAAVAEYNPPAPAPAPVQVAEAAPVETPMTVEAPAPVHVEVESAPVIEAESAPVREPAPQVNAVAPPAARPLAETVPVDVPVQSEGPSDSHKVGLTDWTQVDPSYFQAPTGPYKIGAGDTLEFQAFSDPALNREVLVRFDGNISLPLIEDIKVDGLTREEAENEIRESYRAVFRNPQMSLLVRQTASKTFAVIGDIEKPDIYPYLRPLTLIEAISQAGGLRRRNSSSSTGGFVGVTGQLTKAFVIRHRDGERLVVQFDLRQLGNPGAHAADVPVYFGDLIYVPEGVNLVYLLGESANPVIVELTENMTLLQMLSLSGGFNASTARLRNVVVMRQIDSENTRIMNVNVREILRTGRDIRLQPGDVIYIPQKWAVRLSEFVQRYTGSISPVLDLYNNAVEAYYAKDLAERALESDDVSRTLRRLTDIEQFGTSTSNIVDLFGAP